MAASCEYTTLGSYMHGGKLAIEPTATRTQIAVRDVDVIQGRILWLPLEEDLPKRAVRRAHGKGIVEGIYGHPVVVISRPADESHIVHFHVVTSLQGKTLDELYNKSNDFHTRRRSWFLPIAPTPNHPDAISNNSRKRFPTLILAGGAHMREDSYVNIRHIYSIKWSLLKMYTNLGMSTEQCFRFEHDSTSKLLAKSKFITKYEPSPQHGHTDLETSVPTIGELRPRLGERRNRTRSEPICVSTHIMQKTEVRSSSVSEIPIVSVMCCGTPSPSRSEFYTSGIEELRIADRQPDISPDAGMELGATGSVQWSLLRPVDRLLKRAAAGFEGKPMGEVFNPMLVRRPMNQMWVDAKGATAVFIASIY